MTWELEYFPEAQSDLDALDYGIRVVYKLERQSHIMKIVVISARSQNTVYDETESRRTKHDL